MPGIPPDEALDRIAGLQISAGAGSPDHQVRVRHFAPDSPWEVAVPARPTGQTALSAAQNPQKSEPQLS
eukprot:9851241-Alexandrium_andersonii.AAC.1